MLCSAAEDVPTGAPTLEGVRVLLQEIQATLEARFDRHEEVIGCLIAQQQRLEISLRGRHTVVEERLSSKGSIFPEDDRLSKVGEFSTPLSEEAPHPSKTRFSSEERPTRLVEGGILARAYQRRSCDLILPGQPPAAPADEPLPEDEAAEDRRTVRRTAVGKEEVSLVRRLLAAVKDPSFDIGCGVMVLVNTVLIGVETEYMAVHNGRTNVGFVFGQLGLNLWFTCELALRIVADNCRFLTSIDWKWNLFDAVLVVFSIMDVVQASLASNTEGMVVTGRLLRILRLSRVVRTLRLCRSLNYIHQFRKMVYSLQASVTTLLWSLLLLFFVMFAFSLMFVQGAVEYLGENSVDSGEHGKELKGMYGNVLTACMTLYMAISNGQSWSLLIEPLESVGDDVYVALFLLYIFISTCGVLNVISAVFVESAMASAAHYKDLRIYESRQAKGELVRHMREVFKQIDEDGSGEISFQEMDHFLTDPQLKMYVESLEVTVEDTAMLFKLMDLDDSGVVDIDEFCNGLMRLQGDARSFDMHLLIFEMSKLQKRWDKFVGYVEFMLDELLDATVSPQARKSAWSRVQQWRFANSARSRWGRSVRSRESSSTASYYFSQEARPKGTNATARRVESENSRRAGSQNSRRLDFLETMPDILESPGMQETPEHDHQEPHFRHGSI